MTEGGIYRGPLDDRESDIKRTTGRQREGYIEDYILGDRRRDI